MQPQKSFKSHQFPYLQVSKKLLENLRRNPQNNLILVAFGNYFVIVPMALTPAAFRKISIIMRRFHRTSFTVPDRRCRILLKVVLLRRWATWVPGIWKGEGLGEGEKGEVSLQAT